MSVLKGTEGHQEGCSCVAGGPRSSGHRPLGLRNPAERRPAPVRERPPPRRYRVVFRFTAETEVTEEVEAKSKSAAVRTQRRSG